MPRLSFIVPVFKPKQEVFEKHCKALAAQALKDWEAVFVLDGPSAEARKVIAKTMKACDFSVYEIEHAGANAARNYGGDKATGDFLCFFDSDCVIEPSTSTMWVDQFDKHPEVGFIYSGYKFFGEKYAIEGQPWDPWALKIRNFVSGCFPMRRSLYPRWTEGLKSLQDWDMWLSLVEKAEGLGWEANTLGLYIPGYAFSTAFPEEDSVSGEGCQPHVWPERFAAVKALHKLEDRAICVSSPNYRHDGVALAKMIGADYLDHIDDKPQHYKALIYVGISPEIKRKPTAKQIVFWTSDDINEIWNSVSGKKIDSTAELLNACAVQYCEDDEAKRLLARWGFNVEVFPLPIGVANVKPMPEVKKWVVDMAGDYSPMISVIAQSLPDIEIEMLDKATKLSEYVGLLHFFPDRTTSSAVKRAHLTGRHVISNINQPHCGFVDDKFDVEKFIIEVVDKVRELTPKSPDSGALEVYANSTNKLLEVCA
jgi:hypothetical protein